VADGFLSVVWAAGHAHLSWRRSKLSLIGSTIPHCKIPEGIGESRELFVDLPCDLGETLKKKGERGGDCQSQIPEIMGRIP
jgi:hypothetical protein